ncbi:BED zinc finger [Teladorsagia circumcincta]|uniref:BED zinc finger n=1 Tax=Teladorsagia circumcincta TaxID=45464 RepID=A0A2G9TZ13_TELCI|nr:BED zinc finger [Teladorsagia circumcincta]
MDCGEAVLHGCIASPPTAWTAAAPGTSGASEKPYMKRNRKTEHPVWEYFKRTADGNAQCGICTGVVKSPCSSNFMRHLMRHHSSEYNDVYVKWVQKRAPNK